MKLSKSVFIFCLFFPFIVKGSEQRQDTSRRYNREVYFGENIAYIPMNKLNQQMRYSNKEPFSEFSIGFNWEAAFQKYKNALGLEMGYNVNLSGSKSNSFGIVLFNLYYKRYFAEASVKRLYLLTGLGRTIAETNYYFTKTQNFSNALSNGNSITLQGITTHACFGLGYEKKIKGQDKWYIGCRLGYNLALISAPWQAITTAIYDAPTDKLNNLYFMVVIGAR